MNLDAFEVIGGKKLHGELVPQGAKNEALQILCATLLTDKEVTISNIPRIRDVERLLELLKGLGVKIKEKSHDTLTFQADQINLDFFQTEEFNNNARKISGSVMLNGPLLARFGRAFLPKPGGDKIGRRRLDTHFRGIQKLGGELKYDAEKDLFFVEKKLVLSLEINLLKSIIKIQNY